MATLEAGSRIGGYVVERELGHGGMGTVYLAREEALDRLVAVKVVAPTLAEDGRFRERFLRESRMAARLEHPSIVPVYQAGEVDGRWFLAMRYVPGGSLAHRLAAGPIEVATAVGFLEDIAGALDAAHGAGLVHRDVKPGNVLLDGDRALLADFGLARGAMSAESLSREDGFSGTIGYIAPEQIEGDAVTGLADQYALACVAFECLTRQTPFVRESDVAAIYAHLSEPPPRASSIAPSIAPPVDAVLARALAKQPRDRFESCRAFTAALAAAVAAPSVSGSRRGRKWLVAGLGVAAAAAAAVAVVVTRDGGGPPLASRPDALVALDPASGEVGDVLPLGQRPTALAPAPDGIWVALAGAYQVVRVDRATRQITQRVAVGGLVNGLAAAQGSVWATLDSGRELLRIDPGSGQISQRTEIANAPGAITAATGSLWIASRLDGTVTRFDIASGKVAQTIPIGAGVTAVLSAFGSVWATSEDQSSVTRIDPTTGDVVDTIPVGRSPVALAATRDAVWIANRTDGTVSRLDPSRNAVIATVPVGRAPGTVVAAGDGVLVADDESGAVYRLGPTNASAARVETLHATAAGMVAVRGGILATTVGLPSSHRGGVLRIADGNYGWDMDPALDGSNPTTWVWDTLVRYRRTSGSAGFDLVPDLAQAIPRPSDDGRTYVFRVRRGIRYSNGAEVRPSDFVRAVERLAVGRFKVIWSNDRQPGWTDPLTGVVGFQACVEKPASCDLSRGVVADDEAGTVTYHLADPDADFIRKLTATPTAPVPPGTAVDGAWNVPVPGTGPYMMTSQTFRKELVERRNPYFHIWSADARPDGNPDEIHWLLDHPQSEQIRLIEAGQADGNFWMLYRSDVDRLVQDRPSQLYLTPISPLNSLGYFFDTRRFPLSSRDVRRAINLALDRPAMVHAAPHPAAATCQTVRVGTAGYVPYCPYASGEVATGAPNVALAQSLVRRAGAVGAEVTVAIWGPISDPADWRSRVGPDQRLLLRALRRVGLVPVVHTLGADWQEVFDDRSQISFATFNGGEGSQAPAAADISNVTGDCTPEAIADGAFCDAETKRLLASANAATDPIVQARVWAALDRHLTDEGAWLPIGSGLNTVLLSKRTGNYGQQPAMLGTLWELLTVR